MKNKDVSIIFICLGDYHMFFDRFYESCQKNFLIGYHKTYYVISEVHRDAFDKDNIKFCKVDAPMEKSYKGHMKIDKRQVKLNKFKYISEHFGAISNADYIFNFDADSYIKKEIKIDDVINESKPLTGVVHGWPSVRKGTGKKGKRFEDNPKSSAYVDPKKYDTSEYYQSCLWGGTKEAVAGMVKAVTRWIRKDEKIGHKNKYSICDEIYVNKYFLHNKESLFVLGPEYSNPGEGVAKKWGREEAKGRWGEIVISHECSAQNNTTRFLEGEGNNDLPNNEELEEINPAKTVGWLQTKNRPYATRMALQMFRQHNPKSKLLITSFEGEDLYDIAKEFNGSFEYLAQKVNLFPKKNRIPLVTIPFFLKTLYLVCLRYEFHAKWLINLEDDVESFNTPKRVPKNGSLCGPFGPRFSEEMRKYLKGKAGDNYVGRYSGCGGSILNIKDYIDAYQKLDKDKWGEYASFDNRLNTSCDASMTFVLQNAGYKICRWEEFTGYRNNDKKNFAFAHGSKKNYTNKVPTKVDVRNVYIDCGGHSGQSIREFEKTETYKKKNDWKVYSFEPNFDLIKQYSEEHPEYNFKNEAVWTESCEKKFYIDRKDGDGSSLLAEKKRKDGTVENDLANPLTVKAIDFSSWILDNFQKEDFIIVKMDIEGAEYPVLQKMIKDGSLEYVNKLYVEWHYKKVGVSAKTHQETRNKVRQICSKVFNL